MSDPASSVPLVVERLSASYGGGIKALSDVSIRVGPGELVAVLGANGAGKTTLVRSVAGVLSRQGGKVEEGSVTTFGRHFRRPRPKDVVRAGVSQVAEGRVLFAGLSVDDNLQLGAVAAGRSRSEAEVSRSLVYELFPELEKLSGRRAGLLSGGEQQMVAVGRALMASPRLLLCDEISLGLAPVIISRLFESLARLNEEQGLAILMIEQNARAALKIADRGYVLEIGSVAVEGGARELLADDRIRATYLSAGGLAGALGSEAGG